MTENESPAASVEAPIAGAQEGASAADEPRTAAPEAAPASPPQAQEPDYDSLLSKPEVLEKLFQHDRVKKEIEHRAKSARETDVERRADEKVEARLQQRDADYAAQRQTEQRINQIDEELRQIESDDPTHPLLQRRAMELRRERQDRGNALLETRVGAALRPKAMQEASQAVGGQFVSMVLQFVEADSSLTDEEKRALHPTNPKYNSKPWPDGPREWLSDIFATMPSRQAERLADKLVKERVPKEVDARLAELRGKERAGQASPAELPGGQGGETDKDFIARYADGKGITAEDHKKWQSVRERL